MTVYAMSRDALVDALFTTAAYPSPPPSATAGAVCDAGTDPASSRDLRLRQVLGLAKELLMRDLQAELRQAAVMNSPNALREWLSLHFQGLDHEVFTVVFLDAQNHLIDAETMFRGTLTQTSVYPREVVKAALAHNAAAVVFAHNHPSGLLVASLADRALTDILKRALDLVDIRVLDHFIVAGNRQLSFAEQGLI